MNAETRDRSRIALLAASGSLMVIILLLAGFLSTADAQQEPEKPPFEGVLVESDHQSSNPTTPVDTQNLGSEWRIVFNENFENDNWESADGWYGNFDVTDPSLGYEWGTRNISNDNDLGSTKSAWAVGGGENGTDLQLFEPSYPAGVNSWLVAGPFDFSDVDDVLVTLDSFYEANKGDPFAVAVDTNLLDSQKFVIQASVDETVAEGEGSWKELQVPLTAYVGEETVYIAFTFSSENGDNEKLGVLMDNIKIWVEGEPGTYLPLISYGFTPTPIPVTPTATPQPSGDYEKNFTNNIDGWQARRWTNGTSYNLSHDGGSDDGREGFLNLLVNTKDSHYVIVSPLVAGPKPPYNIETMVKLRSDRNTGDQYGVIFGANYDGGACPATDFSTCFTEYYEMRVRFYVDNDKDRMQMKLKRINSHDSENNNDGPDLIDWTGRISDIDENGFIEWDITVEEDGDIKISANDLPVASARSTAYIDNPYFGLIVRTEDKPDAEAKFDYIKLESTD